MAFELESLAEPPQFGNVASGEVIVDVQARGRRSQHNAADENLDASALDGLLHQREYLGLVFAPSARKIELQFEKAMIQGARFGEHLEAATLELGPPEPRHAPHLYFTFFQPQRAPYRRDRTPASVAPSRSFQTARLRERAPPHPSRHVSQEPQPASQSHAQVQSHRPAAPATLCARL